MKVYISSHDLQYARLLREFLQSKKIEVNSSWLDESELCLSAAAARNFKEISEADVLLVLSGDNCYPGGKYVEAGIALGQGKTVFILGARENRMLHHPMTVMCQTAQELIERLLG
jgi:hypothetical protein